MNTFLFLPFHDSEAVGHFVNAHQVKQIWTPFPINMFIYHFVHTRCAEIEMFKNNYVDPITVDAMSLASPKQTSLFFLPGMISNIYT